MPKMNQADVERIATEYAGRLGCAPFILDGSEFYSDTHPPIWRVFYSFCERSEEWIGLPDFFCVHVDDSTGEASLIPHL